MSRSEGYEVAYDENGQKVVLVGDTYVTPEEAAEYAQAENDALSTLGEPDADSTASHTAECLAVVNRSSSQCICGGQQVPVHWTPEEHDQAACDADLEAAPDAVMFGTLNPEQVTCPECLRALGAYDMAPGQ